MGAFRYKVVDTFKTSHLLRPIYHGLRKRFDDVSFDMSIIPEFMPVRSEDKGIRINLIIPTMRKTMIFGGIATALNIYNKITEKLGADGRIIVTQAEEFSENWTYKNGDYKHDKAAKHSMLFRNDGTRVEIRENDIFIFTSWVTAYCFLPILKWQISAYGLFNRKALYLIQDFEPGFYAWSTPYVLAESTYISGSENIYALFNSKELYDFFVMKGYRFAYENYFRPTLNEDLKKYLRENNAIKREKQILIYGRPWTQRNAFEIIETALMLWSEEYKGASKWRIISLGDYYDEVKLAHNVIEVKGKVNLDEYARYMKASYLGISLMISPHPSYPPLEMSAFGIKTITNTFENKDLSEFNDNIISLKECTPRNIADNLKLLCDQYDGSQNSIDMECEYVVGGSFDRAVSTMGDKIYEMVENH